MTRKRLGLKLVKSAKTDYIKGVLDGDGHMSRGRYIILDVISKSFAEKFRKYLYDVSGHEGSITVKKYKTKQTAYRVLFCSVDAVEFFEDYGEISSPKDYFEGMFDSEGCVCTVPRSYVKKDGTTSYYRRVQVSLSNKSNNIMSFCQDILEELGINTYLFSSKLKDGSFCYHVKLREYDENIMRFSQKINISVEKMKQKLSNHVGGG